MIGDSLKKLLMADRDLEKDHLEEVREFFRDDGRRTRPKVRQYEGISKDQKPMAAVWTKYFVEKNTDHLLADFEQYASCARRGGTIGAMRNPDQDPDEDIRVSIVQQVSLICLV